MSDFVRIVPTSAQPPELLRDGDVSILVHRDTGVDYRLNATAAAMWNGIREPTTLDALTELLTREFDVSEDQCRATAEQFVERMRELGFIDLQTDDSESAALRRRYVDLLKRALVNLIYPEHELRIEELQAAQGAADERLLRDIRYARPDVFEALVAHKRDGRNFQRRVTRFSHTMVGLRRLENIEWCAARIFADAIPGDFAEAGVCQGGAAIFMRALQVAYGEAERRTWLADSFQGLPIPTNPADEGYDFSEARLPWLAWDMQAVQDNFRTYGLLSDNVRFLAGWFSETLPNAPIERLALLRIDADLYESTRDVLVSLYDKVSPGGFVIVDDYHAFTPCRKAVDEFRETRGIRAPLTRVDWTAVYWQKRN
jgi:O-methyltransferase